MTTGQLIVPGTAVPADVRASKKFSSGIYYGAQGTLAEVAGGNTITPGTAAVSAIAANTIANAAIQVAGDANLVAANILSGKSIFGVAGSVTRSANGAGSSGGTAQFPAYYSGSTTQVNGYYSQFQITGLAFTPSVIVLISTNATNYEVVVATKNVRTNTNTNSNTRICIDSASGTQSYDMNNAVFNTSPIVCCLNPSTNYDWWVFE